MNILIICGHGDGDVGAIGKLGRTYYEYKLTRKVGKALYTMLRKNNINCTLYDTSRNAFKDICNGIHRYDFSDFDYTIEIHFNACTLQTVSDNFIKGTEILTPTSNTEHDKKIMCEILDNMKTLGYTNRGVRPQELLVINTLSYCNNAFLLEVCFIDDKDDMLLFNKTKNKVVKAIAKPFLERANGVKYRMLKKKYIYDYPNGKVISTILIKKNHIYTITETKVVNSKRYGKLKSGKGWITMNGIEKI